MTSIQPIQTKISHYYYVQLAMKLQMVSTASSTTKIPKLLPQDLWGHLPLPVQFKLPTIREHRVSISKADFSF